MSLLHPSPGECVDRQTILRLKISNARKLEMEHRHFIDEYEVLQQFLEHTWFPEGKGSWRPLFEQYAVELGKVNQTLWDLEDEIRYLKNLSEEERQLRLERLVTVALAIPEMNDVRARVVAKLNALF